MRFTVAWDDENEQVVRWEFQGIFGWLNYMILSNETAGMVLLSESGHANTLVRIRWWQFPLPDHGFRALRIMINANESFKFGVVVIAAGNPFTRLLLRVMLRGVKFRLARSLAHGRRLLSS